MNMVDRVAAAIAVERHYTAPWEKIGEWHRERMRMDARAAILAMREPSEGMVSASVELNLTRRTGRYYAPRKAVVRWQAMIDSALEES